MPSISTLCNVTSISVLNTLWFIVEGLTPGQTVALYEKTLDTVKPVGDPNAGQYQFPNDNNTLSGLGGVADAAGVYVTGVANALPVTYTNVIAHVGGSGGKKSPNNFPPAVNRLVSDGPTVTVTAGFVPYAYATVAGLVGATGDRRAELTWDPGAKCDARGTVIYNLQRSLSPSMSGLTTVATGIPGTSFTDTGLTNGTTYYYRVFARVKLSTWVMDSSVSGEFSNVVSVTPKLLIEKWGTI